MHSPTGLHGPRHGAWLMRLPQATRIAYIATIFLSAFLLFAVQPMLTKMVLPRLGGSPSVWAVSMCFFQGALLLGYTYAFALNRRATVRGAVLVHLVLLAAACLALPVALPRTAASLVEGGSYLWLVVVLALAVGLPFLAVAANAPLLQAWFAHTGDPDAGEPYFLYRASNAGSLAALLAYPVLIEPMLGLPAQGTSWSIGFVLLALMIGLCGYLMLAGRSEAGGRQGKTQHRAGAASVNAGSVGSALRSTQPTVPVHWPQRLAWIGLAFVPSGLLVAFTTYLTTDVASAPFLWVLPLALYLLTFIVVFRPGEVPGERWLEAAQPIIVAVALFNQSGLGRVNLLVDVGIGLLAFVTTCLVCHRRLYLRRPAAADLTEFYLWMSLGGVLGGIFAAIVAPQIFSAPVEYPLLLALGVAWRMHSLKTPTSRLELAAALVLVAAIVAFMAALAAGWLREPDQWAQSTRLWILLALAAVMLAAMLLPRLQLALVALAALVVTGALNHGHVYAGRSFFGVHRVVERGHFRLLYHGTTLHGAQRLYGTLGGVLDPAALPPAVTYFHPGSTHVLGLELMRKAIGGGERPTSVGVIGLGAGAMACHARAGEKWTFFEIDPLVVDIAKNPRLFSYMSKCAKGADIVLGDARITLAQQKDGAFDYLLFDAFTSDAVPVHLLTVEAIRLYFEKLSERGVLGLHISNKHLDLAGVVAANLEAIPGLSALHVVVNAGNREGDLDALPTEFVLVARHPDILAPAASSPDARPLVSMGARPWTDDFSNVASALVRYYANTLRSREDMDIEYGSAAIAKFPDDKVGYKLRAAAQIRKGNHVAAIDDLVTVARLFPDEAQAFKRIGMIHQQRGNDLTAIVFLTAYLTQNPEDDGALQMRGISYGNTGKREAAIDDLRKVLTLDPGNRVSRQLLARLGALP